MRYTVECMLANYKAGPSKTYTAADDVSAHKIGWEFCKAQVGCIAFSVYRKQGRRKIYIAPEA